LPLVEVEVVWRAGDGDLWKDGQRQVHRAAPGELLSSIIEPLPEPGSRVRVTTRARVQGQASRPTALVTHLVREAPSPVTSLAASRVSNAVRLTWAHATEGMLFRVYRRPSDGPDADPLTAGPTPGSQYDDRSEGATAAVCYEVRAAGVPGAAAESLEAEETCLAAAGPTPPPAPQGLAAVVAGTAVDLSWSPTTDPAVSSYRVYRAIGEAPPVVRGDVSSLVTTFRDQDPPTGQALTYSVTALTRDGLESPPSAAAATRIREP
jgi:fibronectin type 3 domain-containing protein